MVACVVLFSFGGYANGDNLRNTDPSLPLEGSITSCVKEVRENLFLAQLEFEQAERKPEDYSFDGCFLRVTNAPSPRPIPEPINHLEDDQKSFAAANSTLDWIAKKTNTVRKKLKTDAARKTLDSVMKECRIETGDIEKALNRWSKKLPKRYPVDAVDIALHDRFHEASSKAFSILIVHMKPEILAGSADEQADMETLCDYFCAVDSVLDDFFEERGFYGALRNKFVKCYDGVPQADIIARSKILKYINKFGQRALAAVDDPDDYEEQYAVVDLTKNYELAIQLGFVNKTHPDMNYYIFSKVWRLYHFSKHAPELFDLCEQNDRKTIEGALRVGGWIVWNQAEQNIWVDPKGCISIRLKNNEKIFTVGFLAENPKNAKYKEGLDTYILGDRRTEMLKFSVREGQPFIIAGSLDDANTPYWLTLNRYERHARMSGAHGQYR